MLGIVPAAGAAARMQPLGGSKELLPLGRCGRGNGETGERVRAVSEYLLERMLAAGADRICVVVSGDKPDLLRFYSQLEYLRRLFFVVQPRPAGLCDALFRAAPYVDAAEPVLMGLPDTVWYPHGAFGAGLRDCIHLITFPVADPQNFDAVLAGAGSQVAGIEVKGRAHPGGAGRAAGGRVWGALTAPGRDFLALDRLWRGQQPRPEYLGDLLNTWMADGHRLSFDAQGTDYWDIGTPAGYERALRDRVWERDAQVGPSPGRDRSPEFCRPARV